MSALYKNKAINFVRIYILINSKINQDNLKVDYIVILDIFTKRNFTQYGGNK